MGSSPEISFIELSGLGGGAKFIVGGAMGADGSGEPLGGGGAAYGLFPAGGYCPPTLTAEGGIDGGLGTLPLRLILPTRGGGG